MRKLQIGNWLVTAESEVFKIFPKNIRGETVPVTRVNHFVTLTNQFGSSVVFKKYLHQKQWYWRDSRTPKGPVPESEVLREVARMLFKGDQDKGRTLLIQALSGAELAA